MTVHIRARAGSAGTAAQPEYVDSIDGTVELKANSHSRKRTWRSHLLLYMLQLLTVALLGLGSVASAGAPRMAVGYQPSAVSPQPHAPQTGPGEQAPAYPATQPASPQASITVVV